MPAAAWAYYSSGADDEITMRENRNAYQRIWFRPRILRDVTKVDYSSKILGHAVSQISRYIILRRSSPLILFLIYWFRLPCVGFLLLYSISMSAFTNGLLW